MGGEVRRKHCGVFLRLCQDEVEQRDPITIEVKVVPRWLSGKKKKKKKNQPANAGDAGSIPGSGRFPGE